MQRSRCQPVDKGVDVRSDRGELVDHHGADIPLR